MQTSVKTIMVIIVNPSSYRGIRLGIGDKFLGEALPLQLSMPGFNKRIFVRSGDGNAFVLQPMGLTSVFKRLRDELRTIVGTQNGGVSHSGWRCVTACCTVRTTSAALQLSPMW